MKNINDPECIIPEIKQYKGERFHFYFHLKTPQYNSIAFKH